MKSIIRYSILEDKFILAVTEDLAESTKTWHVNNTFERKVKKVTAGKITVCEFTFKCERNQTFVQLIKRVANDFFKIKSSGVSQTLIEELIKEKV